MMIRPCRRDKGGNAAMAGRMPVLVALLLWTGISGLSQGAVGDVDAGDVHDPHPRPLIDEAYRHLALAHEYSRTRPTTALHHYQEGTALLDEIATAYANTQAPLQSLNKRRLTVYAAAATLARSLRQYEAALSFRNRILALQSRTGATLFGYLNTILETVADLCHAGPASYPQALKLLRNSTSMFADMLTEEALQLTERAKADVYLCMGDYEQALQHSQLGTPVPDDVAYVPNDALGMGASGHSRQQRDQQIVLDNLIRHRQVIITYLRAVQRSKLLQPSCKQEQGSGLEVCDAHERSAGSTLSTSPLLPALLQERLRQLQDVTEAIARRHPSPLPLQFPHDFNAELESRPFWSFDDHKLAAKAREVLSLHADRLRQEVKSLMELPGMLFEDSDCLAHDGSWLRYEITAAWLKRDANGCSKDTPAACQAFAELRALSPGFVLRAGYSLLKPGTWIAPHVGATNSQLKLHLPLIVPKTEQGSHVANSLCNHADNGVVSGQSWRRDAGTNHQDATESERLNPPQYHCHESCSDDACAFLRVGDEVRCWKQDQTMFFDDSFEHEVENQCGEDRVVFQVVIAHPRALRSGDDSGVLFH